MLNLHRTVAMKYSAAHPLYLRVHAPQPGWVALTAMLLLVPLVAMQFIAEVKWTPGDFVASGLLVFGTGMAYVLAARRTRTTSRKLFVGALVFLLSAVVWAELAVGLFGLWPGMSRHHMAPPAN